MLIFYENLLSWIKALAEDPCEEIYNIPWQDKLAYKLEKCSYFFPCPLCSILDSSEMYMDVNFLIAQFTVEVFGEARN